MSAEITLTIDGLSVTAPEGTTLLQAALLVDISIPTICYHAATTSNALCRMCVVEVEGSRVLVPACVGKVSAGLNVKTKSEKVQRARRTILEMLASTVDLSEAAEIQAFLQEYQADAGRFPLAQARLAGLIDDNPMFVRDYSKCILCWRCVQVCAEDAQYTFAINFKGRGFETQIATYFEKPLPETSCVFCGQCVGVCPTAALKPKREWLLEQGNSADEIMSLTRTERRRRMRRDANQE
jgi:NADH dehydrogenase/NADH:ubiquinone oxidoreductase subunit G